MKAEYELIDGYITVPDVPIFHEALDLSPEGEEFKWSVDRLAKMVKVNNDRVAKDEAPTIIIHHESEDNPHPPAIGFLDNFKLGLRNGLCTLLARYRVRPEEFDKLKGYPKRSLEVDWKDMTIPSLALLNANPAMNVGTLTFNAKKNVIRSIDKFELGDNKMSLTPMTDDMRDAIKSVLEESDIFAWCRMQMDKDAAEAGPEDGGEGVEVENEDVETFSGKDEDINKTAETVDEGKKEEEENTVEMSKTAKYSKLEQELSNTKAKLRAIERKDVLRQMQTEGYELDVDKQLSKTAGYNDHYFQEHVNTIKEFSRRAPVGLRMDMGSIDKPSEDGLLSDQQIAKVQSYAKQNRVPFDEAMKKVL